MLFVFDYGYKVITFFRIYKFFLTFFILFFIVCKHIYIQVSRFASVPLFSGCRVFRSCVGPGPGPGPGPGRVPVLVVCPDFLNHTHIHTRVHIHARTGIFRR